jgi:hypothetical protein
MNYVIKFKTKANKNNPELEYYLPQNTYNAPSDDVENAKIWKTEKGAQNYLNAFLKQYHGIYYQDRGFHSFLVVPTSYSKPEKVRKHLVESPKDFRKKIIDLAFNNGWKPNDKYRKNPISNDNCGYIIDANEKYAITLKSTVLTIHDGEREFCKVLSMKYNEMEINENFLVSGKIIFQL